MSNIISKIRQRIALKDKNKFNLSSDHITTTDFFRLAPVYFKEMVPGENIKISQATYTRLTPLINPMYGRCRIENRAFFVPMRTIMDGWNEFITDTPLNGAYTVVPTVSMHNLSLALVALSTQVTSGEYDFKTVESTPKMYKFTVAGKIAWQILCSLGYRYPIGYYVTNSAAASEDFNALPLLAFFKIYADWYKNQAYTIPYFDGIFDLGNNNTVLSESTLVNLFRIVGKVVYDKDYFTSAWDRPTTPNNGVNSAVSILDITNDQTGTVSAGSNTASRATIESLPIAGSYQSSTPSIRGTIADGSSTGNNRPVITQYAVDALKSLTDYMKRHQIAGSLAMDRMLARFGVKPSDAALDRSVYLGKMTVDVQIADVMATANGSDGSNTSIVGDYAGKGVGFDKGVFEYSTNEYGYIIVVSSLVPAVGYVQGCSRYCLHRDRLDFFTPEFDSLGVQAIARKELLSDYNKNEAKLNTLTPAAALNGVFGYTSRYAEYKTAQDNLTGDFAVPSLNGGDTSNAWHLNRLFNPANISDVSELSHSADFVNATDSTQYARVFSNTLASEDHFITIHHFEVEDYAPMAKLFDDYDFDGGSKEVSIEVNGTQMN